LRTIGKINTIIGSVKNIIPNYGVVLGIVCVNSVLAASKVVILNIIIVRVGVDI
jgi:hypothetical protein